MKKKDLVPPFMDIDIHFARLMTDLSGKPDDKPLFLAAALLSHVTNRQRNSCLDMAGAAARNLADILADSPDSEGRSSASVTTPHLKDWVEQLLSSTTIGKPGEYKPMILDGDHRLYLYRYWQYEQKLADFIRSRLQMPDTPLDEALKKAIDQAFAQPKSDPDWQKKAATTALTKPFTIISDGPGTGKTHTVTLIIALLLKQNPTTRIAICAPTGKAAARLQDSIQQAKRKLTGIEPDLLSLIPENASTVHRLLGVTKGGTRFRHNSKNPLTVDVLIVDEASMVSLALMSNLLQATSAATRVILLGDKNQLSSVETGAVLGDICDAGAADQRLQSCIVELKFSYRFAEAREIGIFSSLINSGDATKAVALIKQDLQTVRRRNLPLPAQLTDNLEEIVRERLLNLFSAPSVGEAFAGFESFKILCSQRVGHYGVRQINDHIERILNLRSVFGDERSYYQGKPIIIKENDYAMNLYNGDTGIVWTDAAGKLRAFFPDGNLGFFSVNLTRLPKHESAYAITIHESQGSEFDHILIILGETLSNLLTRELLYTAITRAKHTVEIWAGEETVLQTIAKKVNRQSGLKQKLT